MGSVGGLARLALMAAVAIGLAACGSIAPGSSGAIRVVAAENFYGDLTQQIGGDRVQVTSILSDPSIDPHEYESTEQVADYLLKEAGLSPVHGPFQQAVEEGNDPPAQSVQEFQQLLSTRSARILIYNQQTVSALTERMRQRAQAAGVPVVGVRETMPPGSHVQDWMLQTITAVEDALSKTT